MIEIHPSANISKLSDIEDSVRGTRIIIEEGVVIDSFVKIKPAGGKGDVIIGKYSTINSGCVLYTGNGIQIGERVAIAANCTLSPTSHEYIRRNVPFWKQGFRPGKGITIGRDVWIGSNCVILDGTVIGEGCVIGAGSLVRGKCIPFGIYAGNPAIKIWQR